GQPEYTNEDLEEELAGIRPLEIPLHLSEVGRVSDVKHQHYATNTTRTSGELDFEGLTTISDRMSELQIGKESKDNINDSSEWDQNTNTYRIRREEVEQNLDVSNVPPPVTTTTEHSTVNNWRNCLQLVDSVSPKADEDLLELMVRIAENPAEWQQVHHVL
ncbi:hypothetical protein Cfor_11329, partial [Coptotermes formosanus]